MYFISDFYTYINCLLTLGWSVWDPGVVALLVLLLGPQSGLALSAQHRARWLGTFGQEVLGMSGNRRTGWTAPSSYFKG